MKEFAELNGIQVSLEDADLLTKYRWTLPSGRTHLRVWTPDKELYLRKMIGHRMGLSSSRLRHLDKNVFNCRRENLTVTTRQEAMQNTPIRSNNTSGVTGVTYETSRRKWLAYIKVDGLSIYLGRFARFDDAVAARQRAEQKYFTLF